MSSLKEGVGRAQTLDTGGGVTPTYSPEKGAGQSQKNHGREALPLAMILLLCLETVEGTRKKRDTPSHYLPKGRRERKREKKKKREEREKEPRQLEVALYPKQVRIVRGSTQEVCGSTVVVEAPPNPSPTPRAS